MRPGLAAAAVFAGAIVLLIPFLGIPRISSRAEARIPLVGLDVVRTGRVFPPHLLGEPYLNKPPLHHALCAGVIALFGRHDETVVRLPSVLWGALCLLLTHRIAARLAGQRAGLIAAGFLGLSYRFFSLARSAELEIMLAAAMTLAYLGLAKALWSPAGADPSAEGRRPGLSGWWIAAAGVALGCLAKGPVIALLFPAFLLAADAAVRRSAKPLLSLGPLVLLLGALAGTAAYYGPLVVKLGGVQALLDRLAFENVMHARGFHYYWWQLPLGLLPAGIALPWMLAALRRPDPVPRKLALAVAIGVVLFSLSPSKQSHYLLPLYPLVAAWAATSGIFASWSSKVVARTLAGGALALIASAGIAGMDSSTSPAERAMGEFGYRARGRPLAMTERHPVLAYLLDRPDLVFPGGPAAAARFLDESHGFLIVDLERDESLPPELERFAWADRETGGGHTYLLLQPTEKSASGR
jgi:4-amino-4-deoxy-L-arabinose transferase-like glycosyltransferase